MGPSIIEERSLFATDILAILRARSHCVRRRSATKTAGLAWSSRATECAGIAQVRTKFLSDARNASPNSHLRASAVMSGTTTGMPVASEAVVTMRYGGRHVTQVRMVTCAVAMVVDAA